MRLNEKIRAISSTLSNQTLTYKLHFVPKLKPKTNNITDWSSTFFTGERHREWHSFYDTLNSKDVLKVLLTAREEKKWMRYICSCKNYNLALQTFKKVLFLYLTPKLCPIEIQKHFEISNRPSPSGKVVQHSAFGITLKKVQARMESLLSARKTRSIEILKIFDEERIVASIANRLTLAEAVFRKQKTNAMTIKSSYKNLRFITCTSNLC